MVVSAKVIHGEIKNMALDNLTRIQKVVETPVLSNDESSEYEMLRSLGFTNSKNLKVLEEKVNLSNAISDITRKNLEAFNYYTKCLQVFGSDTLLISEADFKTLLKKYNLVVGTLSHYKGVIPLENLRKIKEVRDILNDTDCSLVKEMGHFAEISEIRCPWKDRHLKVWEDIQRFPYLSERESLYSSSQIYFNLTNSNNSNGRVYTCSSTNVLFIVAPKKDMTSWKVKFEILKPEPKDPLIISMTKYGVLVYIMWGDEANDEVLDKYKEISSKLKNNIS